MGSVLRMGARRARCSLLLAAVVFTALPASLALADTTIGQAGGSRAHAAGGCGFSYVAVTVHNQTMLGMHPYFFDYGPTNSVCDDQDPGSVPPGTTSHWKVGDILFGTSAEIRYRFTNGDEVELTAFVYPGERNPSLACGWTQVVSSPRAFDCRANWVSGAVTGKADVSLTVFPVTASATVRAAQMRSPAVRRCAHGSALVGTTTNRTGVSLKLVGVRHGAADAWCRAPRRSQSAHSTARWKLGGPRSGSSARFIYRLPNGDEVDFGARVNPRGGAVQCAPLDRVRTRLFGCRAVRNRAGNSESPGIDFEIFRVHAP